MPKAKGRNAFFFFMLDWRKHAEAQGREFPNGLKDVQQDPDCNKEWQSLTKQEKGPFEAMAKKDKISSQINGTDKRTTHGESIIMLEQKEKEAEMFIKNMQENIRLIIQSGVNLNILPKKKFCFVHVNWFFCKIVNNAVEYFPAEYAFGVFSLENGIEDVHHAIVSAKIPLGYRREALETSQDTHKIPVEYAGGETDFTVMYEKLVNWLESKKLVDQYPYFYTTKDVIKPVRSFIAKLNYAVQQDEKQFQIYEMESLFVHLANELYKKRGDREMQYIPIIAETIFKNFTYIFEKGFECHFHKYAENGSQRCSKSVLRQWAWTLCEEFCKPLEIDMQPGVHCPDSSESDVYTITNGMNTLQLGRQSTSEVNGPLSMTGVSESHRIRVSSRSYEEEMRRRKQSKPVQIIDCSKLQESDDKPVESVSKSAKAPVEEEARYVSKYLNERPLRPPKIDPRSYPSGDELRLTDDRDFPSIGGRGVAGRSHTQEVRKPPLGKGQGHT